MFMTEELLNRTQVCAAVEQMGRKRMPQRVRMHAAGELGGSRPEPQPATNV